MSPGVLVEKIPEGLARKETEAATTALPIQRGRQTGKGHTSEVQSSQHPGHGVAYHLVVIDQENPVPLPERKGSVETRSPLCAQQRRPCMVHLTCV